MRLAEQLPVGSCDCRPRDCPQIFEGDDEEVAWRRFPPRRDQMCEGFDVGERCHRVETCGGQSGDQVDGGFGQRPQVDDRRLPRLQVEGDHLVGGARQHAERQHRCALERLDDAGRGSPVETPVKRCGEVVNALADEGRQMGS